MRNNRLARSVAVAGAVALSAIGVLAAYANEGTAERIAQSTPPAGGPSSFGSPGNPTPLGNLQPQYQVSDLTFDTGLGPFAFSRQYSNSNDLWSYRPLETYWVGLLGEPFGGSPKKSRDGGVADSMLWWHNLYAFVRHVKLECTGTQGNTDCTDPYFVVRDLGGASVTFDPFAWGCDENGAGCLMEQAEGARGFRFLKTAAGFTLFRPDGSRHHFETTGRSNLSFTDRFLTRVEAPGFPSADGSESRQRFELRYAPPAGCNGIFDGNSAGVPYLSEVANFVEGGWRGEKLVFEYGLVKGSANPSEPEECVLTRAAVVPASTGVEEKSVRYSYLLADAGLLASAYYLPSQAIETYGYGDSVRPLWQMERRQDGGTAVRVVLKTLADGGNGIAPGFGEYVLADEDPDSRWLVTAQNPDASISTCPPGRVGAPCSPYQDQIFTTSPASADQYRFLGDGTRTVAQVEQRFQVSADNYEGPQGTQTTKATRKCLSGCPSPIGTAPQSEEWDVDPGWNGEAVPKWSRDRANAYTSYVYGHRDGGGKDTELGVVYSGATSSTGADALSERHFEYSYTDAATGSQQLLKRTWAPTVVTGATGNAGVEYTYDARNRLTAQVAFGKSVDINGTVSDRYVGTFHVYGADPFGRVTEVVGPCLTTSSTATGCSETSYPKKAFEYYPLTPSSANAGKLKYERVYPDEPNGAALTTEYVTYDAQGRVLVQKDVNGVFTCRSYENDRLASVRVGASSDACSSGGEVTQYGYDADGRIKWTRAPSGQYELFCYRKNSTTSCTGGTLTSRVQWKGRGSSDSYSAVKEKVEYEYAASQLVQETTRDASGAVRSVRRYEADPFGRPTFDGWGDPARTGSFSTTRRFDAIDRVTDVGFPYNDPAPFCAGSGCAKLEHDRLGRLISLTEYPTPSSTSVSQKTCYGYDSASNLRQMITGYIASENCDAPDVSVEVTSYQFDDFGNMVATTAPWASGGATRFEHDARGNVIKKKTPAMGTATVEYTYDMLGRVLVATGGGQQLFAYSYDNNGGTAPTGCTTQNTLGRARLQHDSFGATWFSYDRLGRVVSEKRSRTLSGACSGGSLNDNPNGAATYLSDGRVGTITYPHGRVITYGYSTDLPERLASISSNAPFQTSVTLISNIQWEPYGGLRSYVAATSPSTRVEYLKGDNGQATPGLPCSMSLPSEVSNDRTGRLRALWVSSNGGTSGDVFKRGYTWQGDQLVQEDTCLLAELGQTVKYSSGGGGQGYDRRLFLQSVSRPPWQHQGDAGTGGTVGRRDYSYDERGNRTSDVHDCHNFINSYSGGADRLASRTSAASWCGKPATAYGVGFTYDQDGRALTRASPMGNGYTGTRNVIEFDWSLGTGATAATGSVFRSARVNGLVYEYFYDAQGRRRLKDHPIGDSDEYFYLGGALIEDRGVPDDFAAYNEFHTLDEYIWLEGRPVVMVRSMLDEVWEPIPLATDCTRNRDYRDCGTFHIVNDYLAKPVLMLDSSGKVAGMGDYDPFGHVNRVTALGETPHPYPAQTNIALAHLRQPPTSKTDVQVRPRLALLDTESPASGYVYLSNKADQVFGWGCGGPFRADGGVAEPCSEWSQLPVDGVAKIRFKSTSNAGSAYQGAVLEGYEFRRSQKLAVKAWTPIRLPGQYHDAETDLFENWNRFYDPSIGRYLSPDPILLSPGAVVSMAMAGMSTPAYAYANNNPIGFVDPMGLATQLVQWAGISANPWLDISLATAGQGPYGAEVFGGHFRAVASDSVGRGGGGGTAARMLAALLMGVTDTVRAQVLSRLASGDVAGAIEYWSLATGQSAPAWLAGLGTVTAAGNQVAGRCIDVARTIGAAFSNLGNSPQFVHISQNTSRGYMVWGNNPAPVSMNGSHYAVMVGNRIYDAYTGMAGMTWQVYQQNMQAINGISYSVIPSLP